MFVKAFILLVGLSTALLSGVGSINVAIPEKVYTHTRGDNITLPCTFQSKFINPSLVIVSWSALKVKLETEDTVIAHFYSHNGRTDYTAEYEHRARLDVKVATGKADLRLYSITMDENRSYECRVQIPGDDEGTPADIAQMVVLAPPSPPVCKVEGKPEQGQNISLSCLSKESFPQAVYSWDVPDRTTGRRNTHRGSVLFLTNISSGTSGLYTCTSSNKLKSETCNISLSVSSASTFEASDCGLSVYINRAISTAIVFVIICAIVV